MRNETKMTQISRIGRTAALLLVASSLSGCLFTDRLSQVGKAPVLSQIENPANMHGNQPLVMPMPKPTEEVYVQEANSLWRRGSRSFFKDQRARNVGDLITVDISIDDSANISNETERTRDNAENAGLTNFLGWETTMGNMFTGVDPTALVNANSDSKSNGKGTVSRNETINMTVAAMVTQVLPNGNMVIAGRQETRVNFEVRELQVAGIIRAEDITNTNTINFDQIAEARISYGGRGQLSDVQQPRYGQQVYDIIWPF
ncbi:flagellar basal body L-ring protein FlgH [Rhodovibrionaceae bacterium A322]